jgi:hypothetical protein
VASNFFWTELVTVALASAPAASACAAGPVSTSRAPRPSGRSLAASATASPRWSAVSRRPGRSNETLDAVPSFEHQPDEPFLGRAVHPRDREHAALQPVGPGCAGYRHLALFRPVVGSGRLY